MKYCRAQAGKRLEDQGTVKERKTAIEAIARSVTKILSQKKMESTSEEHEF